MQGEPHSPFGNSKAASRGRRVAPAYFQRFDEELALQPRERCIQGRKAIAVPVIRMIRIDGKPGTIAHIIADLVSKGCDPAQWSLSADKGRLSVAALPFMLVNHLPDAMKLSYALVSMRPGIT